MIESLQSSFYWNERDQGSFDKMTKVESDEVERQMEVLFQRIEKKISKKKK